MRELGRKYGVSHTCISGIVNDKYKYADKVNIYEEVARPIVDTLNELRDMWFNCDDEVIKNKYGTIYCNYYLTATIKKNSTP